jgi:hypothetical protein
MAGEFDEFGVGRGRRPVQPVPDERRVAPDAVRDGLNHCSGGRLRAKAEAGQGALQRGGSQRVGGPIACAPRSIQPAAAFDGF